MITHKNQSGHPAKTGFILIEVLIAVVITAVIAAALYSTFFLSRKAVDAVDDSLVKLQECRTVLDILKREIESAVYDKNKQYTLFKIDDRDFYGKQASQLVMTTFTPLSAGLTKITYVVEENDDKQLILRKKMDAVFGTPYETKSVDLIEDVESFSIEAQYIDKWVKTWDSTVSNGPPAQVRISVTVRTKKDETPFTISDIANWRVGRAL